MWNARELTTLKEREDAFRLRYEVFAKRLAWIPTNERGLDVDSFDLDARHIGVYRDNDGVDELVATCRIIPYGKPWMLHEVFPYLVHPVSPDSMELSRLSISNVPSLRQRIMAFGLLIYRTAQLIPTPWVYAVTTEDRARAYTHYGIKLGVLAEHITSDESIVSIRIDMKGTDWKTIVEKSLTEEYR